ncbi:transposase, partial [Enterococcus faecium]
MNGSIKKILRSIDKNLMITE